jgi:hypothetical protein
MPMLTPFQRHAVDHPADQCHAADVRFGREERTSKLQRSRRQATHLQRDRGVVDISGEQRDILSQPTL